MVRPMLTPEERERGRRLGALLRQARGIRSMSEVAVRSGIPVETLRKIETGRIPTPAFFTIAALADVLDLELNQLVTAATVTASTVTASTVTAAVPAALTA